MLFRSGLCSRHALKDLLEVEVIATNRHNRAFLEVRAKALHVPKASQDRGEIVHVPLDGSNKDRRVIRIKGGTHHGSPTTDLVEEPFPRRQVEDLMQGVYCQHEEEGEMGSPCRNPRPCLTGR